MKPFIGAFFVVAFCLNVSFGREIVIELPDDIEVSSNSTVTKDSFSSGALEPTVLDTTNANLRDLRETNMNLQDFIMDEFSRFTLTMDYVINFGRLIPELHLTAEELDQLTPFYDYVMLSQDHFNTLINEMIIFSYSPRDILYKNLPEYLLQRLSDLLGEALSQSKRKFAEAQEYKASADYEQLSQTLEDGKDLLATHICKLKEEITKDGPRDEAAFDELKTTTLDSIVKTSRQMFETISTFNHNNNKFLESVYEIVPAQKDLSTKIALAYITVVNSFV